MSKQELQREIRALYAQADGGTGLAALLDGICDALRKHPDALAQINGSYAVRTLDTGLSRAFALKNGTFADLPAESRTDVTIAGREGDLLRVFRRELSPMAALLRGKLRVSGDKAALMRFAEFL